MSAKTTLRMKRTYRAPARRVFDAWTSEEVMRRWWHAERDWETSKAEVDLRVGGSVRVVMRDPGEDAEYGGGGRYTVVDPPHRLAFTWVWDHEPHETLIEIEFEESDGATTVRFTHSGLLDEEMLRSHEGGWGRCFDNLERTLEEARPQG
ncbi:MAG TPA: SRPBCC family protein [Solirubrobacterales bacterium]|nr:SRPBCC family protein [Solirubrobacterales bacterium]